MSETNHNEPEYKLSFLRKSQWILGLFILFVITFALQFELNFAPVTKTAGKNYIQNSACPLSYDDYNFKFNGIVLNNVQLSAACTGGQPLTFKTIELGFSGFSFSPFGPTFNIETELLNNPVEVDIAVGFTGFAIVMENESTNGVFEDQNKKINLATLSDFLPVTLMGDLFISNLHFKADYQLREIDILTVNIVSKNFIFPSQTISAPGMPFPFAIKESLIINDFLILGELESTGTNPTFKLERLTIGDDQSPIRSEFKGKLGLSLLKPQNTKLDLLGELKLSESFPQRDLLVNFGLSKFDQKDGFYQIQLKGPANIGTLLTAKSPR